MPVTVMPKSAASRSTRQAETVAVGPKGQLQRDQTRQHVALDGEEAGHAEQTAE